MKQESFPEPATITVKEAAAESRYSEKTIRRWIALRKFKVIQAGPAGHIRIPKAEWARFAAGRFV